MERNGELVLKEFPDEILHEIYLYLTSSKDYSAFKITCQRFKDIG